MLDPRVNAYLDAAPDWQRRIMQRVRSSMRPIAIEETIKRTVQPYFVLQGNVAAFRSIIADNGAGGWRKLKEGGLGREVTHAPARARRGPRAIRRRGRILRQDGE
jgi:hypothetical protein